jgi:hypothetical protein
MDWIVDAGVPAKLKHLVHYKVPSRYIKVLAQPALQAHEYPLV